MDLHFIVHTRVVAQGRMCTFWFVMPGKPSNINDLQLFYTFGEHCYLWRYCTRDQFRPGVKLSLLAGERTLMRTLRLC